MLWLFGKLKAYLAAAGAIVLVLTLVFTKGRLAGSAAERTKQQSQARKRTEKFNEIDASRPDLDASLGRLRDRAKGRHRR